ncbi:MAG TPA: hypothetical protein VHA07_07255 [Devosia sp.]|nr:hypothetical protein [Devosia sp.]
MLSRHLLAAAALLLATGGALAQDGEQYRCYSSSDPRCADSSCANTFYNPDASLNWQRTVQSADAGVMQQMAGVYYGEQTAPQLGMIERVYRSYEPNGLWQYQDETCGSAPGVPCSQNQGAGQWAAYQQADGSIFVMIHFSDLSRYNNCFSQTLRLGQGGFVDDSGVSWSRVR